MRQLLTATLLLTTFAAGFVIADALRATPAPTPEALSADTVLGQGLEPGSGRVLQTGVVAPAGAAAATTLTDFSRIAERTIPVVVNISAEQIVRRRVVNRFPSPVELFTGRPEVFTQRSRQNSLGSGVIVSRDGYVLTNNHVVTGEASSLSIEQLDVTVTLADQRELSADVVGVDPATVLALLKVEATDLPTMPWGDSTQLKVAEWVLAIGNPYQLSQTVTLGIVSAVGRTNLGVSTYEDFIQTDAAINPGNSGGALINARGELVGINTVIFSQSGGYQGIGFAVSSNLAQRVLSDLQQYREVRRGSIGLTPENLMVVTTELARRFGAPDTRGALIASMFRPSSAFVAGLRPGDIIVALDGTPIEEPEHFARAVVDARIGSTARVEVIREGERRTFDVPVVKLERQAN
jgi:serine protease Do